MVSVSKYVYNNYNEYDVYLFRKYIFIVFALAGLLSLLRVSPASLTSAFANEI